MKIVILGAGQVGGTLARNLSEDDNSVTIVDKDEQVLRELQHRLDIKTIQGLASHPYILVEAGIEQADMLIAVTNSDETNMIACQIAYSLFQTPLKIARLRSHEYYLFPKLFCNDHIPIDECIRPEQLVTEHIAQLIQYPGAEQIFSFCDNRVLLVSVKVNPRTSLYHKSVEQLNESLSAIEAQMVAIIRHNERVQLDTNSAIELDDEIFFIASPYVVKQVLSALGFDTSPIKRVMIAGGGHIGSKLAEMIESKYRVKIIEKNIDKATNIAGKLTYSTVLQGDIADHELLKNENIEFTDLFCAVTNDDEANIMSCLQAKRLGTKHVYALVNRTTYVDLIKDSQIDHAISPQTIMIGSILTNIRRASMVTIHRLPGKSEAIELIVRGDKLSSHVIGRTIEQLNLPQSIMIAAIVRDDKVLIASPDIEILTDDHVILLTQKKRDIKHIESLFQVNFNYEFAL